MATGEVPGGTPARRVNGRPGVRTSRAQEGRTCLCGGSASLLKGILILRPELKEAASARKEQLAQLLNRDEYSRTKKRSAANLVNERARLLRDKLEEWSSVRNRASQAHSASRARTVAAATELSAAMNKNVDPNVLATLRRVHHLTMVVEKSNLNNLRRFALKVDHYTDRLKDCEEEAAISTDELNLLELDLSTVIVNRREQLKWLESVNDFLQIPEVAAGN